MLKLWRVGRGLCECDQTIYYYDANFISVMILERQERVLLEAVKRRLEQDLQAVNRLLKSASAPKLESRGDSSRRALSIVQAVKAKGGHVKKSELADIASSRGMIETSVGSLYQGGWLRKDPKDDNITILGPRARALRKT